jgi:hypothetical protein
MASWIITDDDRDEEGNIRVATPAPPSRGRTLADVLPPLADAPAAPDSSPAPASDPRRWGRAEIAGVVSGLVVAVALIALINALTPVPAASRTTLAPPTEAPTVPTEAPTAMPVPHQDAYAAPDGAKLGTVPMTTTIQYRASAHPGWGGFDWDGGIVWVQAGGADLAGLPDLTPPRPTARPAIPAAPFVPAAAPPAPPTPTPCDPASAPYSVTIDVTGERGIPIGTVMGISCVSRDEAAANAEAAAAQMRTQVARPPAPGGSGGGAGER